MPLRRALVGLGCALQLLATQGLAQASAAELGAEAAAIPIIDAHFHVMMWIDAPSLVEHMDRNHISMAGGVGGGSLPTIVALGERFIRPTGMGAWLGLHRKLDAADFENPETPAVRSALAMIEADLRDRGARVIGEIHVNALTTTQEPANRFKTPADSATLKAIFALAGQHGRPLNVHAQWDTDTVQQLERLADSFPSARLVLAHCGSNSTAGDVREMFERHANVCCDLSARGSPPLRGRTVIFSEAGLDPRWQRLIEDYPDRFVVGIDTVHDWQEYDGVVRAIRRGLLAHLSPETARRVASGNAEEWFGLR